MPKTEKSKKALFYIEGKEVQHAGLRLLLTKKMIQAGFTKGGAFNMPDGRVEVVLEDTLQKIEAFHSEIRLGLKNWLELAKEDAKTAMGLG